MKTLLESDQCEQFESRMDISNGISSDEESAVARKTSLAEISFPPRSPRRSPSPADSETGRLVIAFDDSQDGVSDAVKPPTRENSPDRPSKRPGLGFMDSSDEEPDIPPVTKFSSPFGKSSMKKSISDDSDEEENVPRPSPSSSTKMPSTKGDDVDSMLKSSAKKTITRSDSEEDESFVVEGEKSRSRTPLSSPGKNGDFDGEMFKLGSRPLKDRVSKKRAMQEMDDLNKETQRLLRETKVALPKHAPVARSFNDFFEEMRAKPSDSASAPKRPCIVDLENAGKPGPMPAAMTKEDFLALKRKLRPAPELIAPVEPSYDILFDQADQPTSLSAAPLPDAVSIPTVSGASSSGNVKGGVAGEISAFVLPDFMKPKPAPLGGSTFMTKLMASQTASTKPSFIDLSEDGDEEPAPAPVSKLDRFISNFLKHARPAAPASVTKVSSDSVAASVPSSGSAVTGSLAPVVSESVVKPLVKQFSMAQFDRLRKPGAKLTALKAMLEDGIMDKKEVRMQRQLERARAEEARQPEEQEKEPEDDEEEEEEMTDGEDDESDTTESEPDEAEIVDDDYGKDQKEPEENEFEIDEAEEAEEDEVSGDEDEELGAQSDIDLEASSSDGDDSDENDEVDDVLKGAACDEDEDPLAGLGDVGGSRGGRTDDDSNGSSTGSRDSVAAATFGAFPNLGNMPGSLGCDLEPEEREKMQELFGAFFGSTDIPSGSLGPLPAANGSAAVGEKNQRNAGNVYEKDLMGSLASAGAGADLMGLLSCASADFKTLKPRDTGPDQAKHVKRLSPRPEQVDDVFLKPVKAAASKMNVLKRRRMLMDSDNEEDDNQALSPEIKNAAASDIESEEEEAESIPRRRIVRIASESEEDEDADDEEEEEEDDFIEKVEEAGTFRNEDEEMEYLERQFKPDQPVKATQFFEAEAEISDDDYRGSGDEDEDGLDEIRQEDIDFQDNRYFSLKKQQREAIPEYLRKLGEDDEELQEALVDRFIREDDDLPKLPSTSYGEGITFRLNDDGEIVDDDNGVAEDAAEDNAWRIKRFEREQLLASREVNLELEEEPLPNMNNSFAVYCKNARENADSSFNLQSESFSQPTNDGKPPVLFKRNSILSRGSAVLARLNEVIDVEERKTAPQPILAMQSAQYRKSLSMTAEASVVKKYQRTESSPAGDGPAAKRRRLGQEPPSLSRKPSLFSVLGN